MKKGRNAAEILDSNIELDGTELSGDNWQERTLILKAAPPSRRAQLMAHGAVEIRCIRCGEIKPLAHAEEHEEGWICEDCVSVMTQKPKHGRRKRR
jgi:hypothetical protein